LKAAEIPIAFYNIRAPYNVFTLTNNGTTTPYKITPGNYDAAGLKNALNTAVTSAVGIFSYDATILKYTFTTAAGVTSVIPVTQRSLAYFMGFVNGQTGTNGSAIVATNSYVINFDTYINVYIENLRPSSMQPMVPVTFKIPITSSYGNVEQYFEQTRFVQKIKTYDPDLRIDRLNIIVYDRYGNILDNNGVDWSFTLELEADT
jgi:hypothetical protein